MNDKGLTVHVGYPKCASTSLQLGLFSRAPGINYLGKLLPSHRYVHEDLYPLVNSLMADFDHDWLAAKPRLVELLRKLIAREGGRRQSVISSENFIHPWSIDPSALARRLADVAPAARILIVIREQAAILRSFYRWHGGFGHYLYLNAFGDERFDLPLTADQWLKWQLRYPTKNFIGYLDYNAVVRTYEELFGPDRVEIVLFEDIATASSAAYEAIGRAIGLPAAECAERLAGVRANSEEQPPLGVDAAKILPGDFDAVDKTLIRQRFAAGNAELVERHRIDLARHGYALTGN